MECRGGYNNVIPRCVLCYAELIKVLFGEERRISGSSNGAEGYSEKAKKVGLALDAKILNLNCRDRKPAFVFIINV